MLANSVVTEANHPATMVTTNLISKKAVTLPEAVLCFSLMKEENKETPLKFL